MKTILTKPKAIIAIKSILMNKETDIKTIDIFL
jgi:hypothetical protein